MPELYLHHTCWPIWTSCGVFNPTPPPPKKKVEWGKRQHIPVWRCQNRVMYFMFPILWLMLYKSRGLTFSWWGCNGLCLWHKPPELDQSVLPASCVFFCLYSPFNCISFLKLSRQTLCFFTLFFRPYLCLTGPFNYMSFFMKVSFNPDIIHCGWLGSKHQLINWPTYAI